MTEKKDNENNVEVEVEVEGGRKYENEKKEKVVQKWVEVKQNAKYD